MGLAGLTPLLVAAAALAEPGSVIPVAPMDVQRAVGEASCSGEYADAILALSARAREFERSPEANFAYCLRNTATYECLYYGSDGKVRRRQTTVVAHGTAFAYREKNGDTFLLTNDHVATWPAVTDDDHEVSDVPAGCKKVDEQLRIVRDESDDYEPGQIPVQKVVTDPALDAAVLKTRAVLNVMPYRVGRSALLKAGNVVEVRGYPLGLLEATNSGKVVTAYDPDRERSWNHVDFVTDALVTKGNSGSPVLAVSCRTGELELVGVYHAGYRGSPALNTVVGIDQIRDLMDNFRRSRPAAGDASDVAPGPELRDAALALLSNAQSVPFFRLGDRLARVRGGANGALVYDIFSDDFPARDRVALSLEESAAGALVAFSADTGKNTLPRLPLESADAETQDLARKLHDLVRRQLKDTLAYRLASADAPGSRDAFRRAGDLSSRMAGRKGDAQDLVKSLSDVAAHIADGSRGKAEVARSIAETAAGVTRPVPMHPPDGDAGTPTPAAAPDAGTVAPPK